MFARLQKDQDVREHVLIPLDREPEAILKEYKAEIVQVGGESFLKISRSDYEAIELWTKVGHLKWAAIAPHAKSCKLADFLPKAPWEDIVSDYKLKRAMQRGKEIGLNVPEVIQDEGR